MTIRRSFVLVAVALSSLVVACGDQTQGVGTGTGSDRTDGDTTETTDTTATTDTTDTTDTTLGEGAPPPAEVLDATTVYFDADGDDNDPSAPRFVMITDERSLDAFAARFVDGDPSLGSAARSALDNGQVLIGGAVSSGCFAASGAIMAFTADDVRLVPTGLAREDPNVDCARAITSVALMAILPSELPNGVPLMD